MATRVAHRPRPVDPDVLMRRALLWVLLTGEVLGPFPAPHFADLGAEGLSDLMSELISPAPPLVDYDAAVGDLTTKAEAYRQARDADHPDDHEAEWHLEHAIAAAVGGTS